MFVWSGKSQGESGASDHRIFTATFGKPGFLEQHYTVEHNRASDLVGLIRSAF
jgi:hypothetical protein